MTACKVTGNERAQRAAGSKGEGHPEIKAHAATLARE